jgi:hypothetical protein
MTSPLTPISTVLALWVCTLLPLHSSAQKLFGLPASAMHDHTTCTVQGCDGLVGIPEDKFIHIPPPPSRRNSVATINVSYINFPPDAEAAFQYAVNIWAGYVYSDVPIDVEATWASLGTNILGSASPSTIHRNFAGALVSDVYFPAALANQLAANDLQANSSDITCNFGSDVNWYFGLDGNVPAGAYDFVTVVLHELCHGLGFIGSATVAGATGFIGQSGSPFIYDTFINDNNTGGNLLDLNVGTSAMGAALTGGGLVWSGPEGVAASLAPPGIYAPNPWEPGASFSHLREDMYLSGDQNALMTPNLNTGEAIHNPGPIVAGMFSDMGWGVQGCAISSVLPGAQLDCNPATDTYSQQLILIYDNAPPGLINVNGSLFTISGSPQTISLNNLPANGLPVDIDVFFTGDPDCMTTYPGLFTAAEPCAGGTCNLTSYTLTNQTACNPADGTYNQTIQLGFAFSAGAGDVIVNGQQFPVTNGLAVANLTGLIADGGPVDMLITFTESDVCAFAVFDAWTAPAPCPCSIDLEVNSLGSCESASGSYDLGLVVHVTHPPFSGLLNIGGDLFEVPSASGSYTTVISGLPANGEEASIGAFFTDLPSCSAPEDLTTWTAPSSCECPGDLDGDGIIGVSDTLDMLANFGCIGAGCVGDIDGDTIVGVSDILELLSAFGVTC